MSSAPLCNIHKNGWQNSTPSSDENSEKISEKAAPDGNFSVRCCPVLSAPCPVWVGVWVSGKEQKFDSTISAQYERRSPEILRFQDFLVETAGLEPVTSCVWRTAYRRLQASTLPNGKSLQALKGNYFSLAVRKSPIDSRKKPDK